MYMHVYIYIYIERERDREIERWIDGVMFKVRAIAPKNGPTRAAAGVGKQGSVLNPNRAAGCLGRGRSEQRNYCILCYNTL